MIQIFFKKYKLFLLLYIGFIFNIKYFIINIKNRNNYIDVSKKFQKKEEEIKNTSTSFVLIQ
jgi:hypothetical protein